MEFSLPEVRAIKDRDGHKCLSQTDAQAVAQALACDPAQPFRFNTNCGHRAQLMIGRLIANNFPMELIYRAESHAAEPAPAEAKVAYTHRNPPHATFQSLVGGALEGYPATRDIPGTKISVHFLDPKEVYIYDKTNPRGNDYTHFPGYENFPPGFALRNDGESNIRMEEHHSIAFPVLNEKTGISELRVIDPHLTVPVRLISFREWKEMQHCDSLVMLSAPVGKAVGLVLEEGCLRPEELEKLQKLILEYAPEVTSKSLDPMTLTEIKTALIAMDHQTVDQITMAMLNSKRELKRIPDWDSRSAGQRAEFIDYLVSVMEPLAITEQKWRERFLLSENKPASFPVALKPDFSIT